MDIISKQSAGKVSDKTFVISDESPDRVNDVVVQAGISLTNFNENPVALVGHDRSQMPIGVWKNFRIQGTSTLADLQLATKGTSREADLARSLIDQGILRAVSVGFRPLQSEPIKPRGMKYIKSELLEISLVSVPMHPRAVLVAKSLKMTDAELDQFFIKSPVGDAQAVQKALNEQALRFADARKRGIYALINATRQQRKYGEL